MIRLLFCDLDGTLWEDKNGTIIIKDDDIHRPNHLIIKGFRAIYMYGKKEENHVKEYNPNRRVTAIEKKA